MNRAWTGLEAEVNVGGGVLVDVEPNVLFAGPL